MSRTKSVSDLRFALSDSEAEVYHLDGVVGPYMLLPPAEMHAAWEVIDREIISPTARENEDLDFHDRHLDHPAVCRSLPGRTHGFSNTNMIPIAASSTVPYRKTQLIMTRCAH